MITTDYGNLENCIQQLYEKAGVNSEDARRQAENLVSCEAKGIWSHGVGLAKRHLEDVVAGKINLTPNITVTRESASTAMIDGDNGLGTAVAVFAVKYAIEKAKKTGCASIGVTGGNHFGAGQYFAELAIAENMIIYIYTTGDATMVPFGGTKKYFGTNPYTYGAPAGKYPPYILDMATTLGAARKVQQCQMDGLPAPEGWGIDKYGNPTTDPQKILGEGAMLPFGGPKGFGIAGMVDIMGGVLNGSAYRDDICCMPVGSRKVNNGYFVQVIDIASFIDPKEFNRRMEIFAKDVCSNPPAPGFKEVFYPGYKNGRDRENAMKKGLLLNDTVIKSLEQTAALVNVKPSGVLELLQGGVSIA